MNYKGVSRRAPATPGLKINCFPLLSERQSDIINLISCVCRNLLKPIRRVNHKIFW